LGLKWDSSPSFYVSTVQFECDECGEPTEADIKSARSREQLCYKHYVKGIKFALRGPQGGRESFHNDTIASVTREAVDAARAQGREIRPKNKVNGAFSVKPAAARAAS
jgi:hypothetical protein